MKKIEFLQAGESPDFGVFVIGQKATMSDKQAKVLESRGVLKILNKKPSDKANEKKTEVNDNGKE